MLRPIFGVVRILIRPDIKLSDLILDAKPLLPAI